jgi:hypothetical protein
MTTKYLYLEIPNQDNIESATKAVLPILAYSEREGEQTFILGCATDTIDINEGMFKGEVIVTINDQGIKLAGTVLNDALSVTRESFLSDFIVDKVEIRDSVI